MSGNGLSSLLLRVFRVGAKFSVGLTKSTFCRPNFWARIPRWQRVFHKNEGELRRLHSTSLKAVSPTILVGL